MAARDADPARGPVAALSDWDAQLERLRSLNAQLAEFNGLAEGITSLDGVIAMFDLASFAGRGPAALLRRGVVLRTTPDFRELTGWEEEEIAGRPATDLVPAGERANVESHVEGRSEGPYRTRVLCRDGSQVSVLVRAKHVGAFRVTAFEPLPGGAP